MKYLPLILILFGCASKEQYENQRASEEAAVVRFFYHEPTKLCFARGGGLATVPCTPEVLALCPNRPQ